MASIRILALHKNLQCLYSVCHVALALAQNARLAGKEQFRIRPSLIASIGVNRSTLYRSLVRMQEASLLEVVEKGPGRSPTIRLLDIVPEGCTW